MMISKKSKIDVDANNGYLFLSYLIFLRIAIFLAMPRRTEFLIDFNKSEVGQSVYNRKGGK